MNKLDIGCGRWKLQGAIGIDQNKELAQFYPSGEFICMNLLDPLPFDNESQDEVFAAHIIEHFSDPRKLIAEIHRVLKPSGVFRCYYPVDDPTDQSEFGHKIMMSPTWFEDNVTDLFEITHKKFEIKKIDVKHQKRLADMPEMYVEMKKR